MAQLTVAISEHLVQEAVQGMIKGFRFSTSGSTPPGGFTASYEVELHLEGGTVDLRDDNTILIKELDVKWDKLKLTLGIDIPEVCTPDICLIPIPFDGCALELPGFCVFSGNPDISIPLDLGNLITSELSVSAGPMIRYVVHPQRDPNLSDWDNEENGHANKYQIFVNPDYAQFDLFDIPDMAGDLAEAINKAIKEILEGMGLPDLAVDLIMALLGPIPNLLRDVLDLGDDFGEWMLDLIGDQLGFLKAIALAIADYFNVNLSVFEVSDPYRIMAEVKPDPNDPKVIPMVAVKLPITQLDAHINTDEMVLEGSVGE